jgi:CMP-N-acetylneuraminic acid synthetase
MILGIIPARGGSKGIKDKNIFPLCGKPLIQHTIEAAGQSNLDDFVVTTDSLKILGLCPWGIIRPSELAQDDTPMLPVIQYVVKQVERLHEVQIDVVMILQPTSPLRTVEDINNAIDLFNKGNSQCLVSVCEGVHPKKSYTMDGKPLMEQTPYDKHLDGCYTRNGAIFITSKRLLDSGRLFDDHPLLCVMPRSRSVDIDSYDDVKIAEALLKL